MARTEDMFQIDINVNNAGRLSRAAIEDVTQEKFEEMHSVDLLGPLLLKQSALPYLLHGRSARIVWTGDLY